MRTKIYALLDKNDNIRYIGKTLKSLEHRLSGHIYNATKGKKDYHSLRWIRKCIKEGYKPRIKQIAEVDGDGCAEEIMFIELARSLGAKLTNSTNGGEGTVGYHHTDETKKLISSILKGKPGPNLGKKFSEEHRKNIGKGHKGIKISKEVCEKMSIARSGKKTIFMASTIAKKQKPKYPKQQQDIFLTIEVNIYPNQRKIK